MYFFLGTYFDAVSPDGQGLSDYMLLCSVVATILVIVNTAQVSTCYNLNKCVVFIKPRIKICNQI